MQIQSARAIFCLLAAIALGGACTSKGPGNTATDPDAGGESIREVVGRACNVDSECKGLRCDKVRRTCICLSDESCVSADADAGQQYCNNFTGLCVNAIAGCISDEQCPAIEFCDPSIRACRPRKSFCEDCTKDSECGGPGDHCIPDPNTQDLFCSRACNSNIDCAAGSNCEDRGRGNQCYPAQDSGTLVLPATCKNFQGCTPDSLIACNSDGGASNECTVLGDQRCDTAQGRCVAISQICPFGTVCDPRAKICVAECAIDEDCGAAGLRCVNRVCEPVSECANNTQCPANKICVIPQGKSLGTCEAFCRFNSECPLGQACTTGPDGKNSCQPGCSSTQNCPPDQRCNLTTRRCEGPTVGSARICQTSAACNTCELCNATQLADGGGFTCYNARQPPAGNSKYCQACDPSVFNPCSGGACVSGAPGDLPFFCAPTCRSQHECAQGFVCLTLSGDAGSACVPSDRRCLLDGGTGSNKCQ